MRNEKVKSEVGHCIFRLQTSDFRLLASGFRLQTSFSYIQIYFPLTAVSFIFLQSIISRCNSKLFMKVTGEITLRAKARHSSNLIHFVIATGQ
jgi:hypothetical protein